MNETAAPGTKGTTRWLERIVRFPVTRMLVFIGVIAVALCILGLATEGLDRGLGAWCPSGVANVALPSVALHVTYCAIVRVMEQRLAGELLFKGAIRETGTGALIGAGCLTLTVGLIALPGYHRVEGTGPWAALMTALGTAAFAGYIAEVIFRGVIFRLVEEGLGSWLALAITVALFGLVHLGNPNATLYGAAAIGIEAGMLLGAPYVVTPRLWLAVGVHFGWNFMQAVVFGPDVPR